MELILDIGKTRWFFKQPLNDFLWCQDVSILRFRNLVKHCWWLSYQPLWKIWVSWDMLGWWHSQLNGEVIGKSYSKPPTRSNELVMSYKFRGKHLHFFEWFPVHSWILIWNASPVNGDIWYLGLPLYVFVASENALFLSGWCHCFGFGIFLMPSIFPFLMVCIFGLHHGPIPSFGDIFRQSNSQILNYGIVM